MFRSLLFVLFVIPYALAQTGAPPQSQEQHAPAQPAQAPDHSQHATPAQGTAAASPAPAAPRATLAKPVAPTAPVIVLNGFCEVPAAGTTAPAAAANKANCKKVITKAEFEKIVDAVIPKARRAEAQANPQVMQGIAKQYAEILVMSNEAKKRGLQRQPSTQELLRISQLQVLAQSLLQDLNEKSAPTPAEIEKYYTDNKPAFEEAIVRRVVIPKETAAATPPANKDAAQPKAPAEPPPPAPDAAAQKAFAEKARERAVAGEDLEKIQKDAFEATKNTQPPPSTQLGPLRRGSLPPDHDAALFALKTGEVSQLFDTGNGWYFYKVESKRTLPLSEVREELTRRLQPQKFNDARTAVANSVQPDLNQDYFGATLPSPVSASTPGAQPARPGLQRGPATPRTPRTAPQPTPAQPTQTPESQPKPESQQPK